MVLEVNDDHDFVRSHAEWIFRLISGLGKAFIIGLISHKTLSSIDS